jgi:hypothetical protein
VGALSNLGVVHFRLGAYSRAQPYAREAVAQLSPDSRDLAFVGAVGVDLCCAALLGQRDAFTHALQRARDATAERVSNAVDAHCHYWIAEAFWLLGEKENALQEARLGLAVVAPQSPGLLGIMARWCALVAQSEGASTPPERLLRATDHLEVVDMFDRLEISLGILRFPILEAGLRAIAEAATAKATVAIPQEVLRESYRFFHQRGVSGPLPQHPHPST